MFEMKMAGEVGHLKEALALNTWYSILGMLAGILRHVNRFLRMIKDVIRMNLYLAPAVLLVLR